MNIKKKVKERKKEVEKKNRSVMMSAERYGGGRVM